MQRIFWQRLNELPDRREVTGKDGGPVETREMLDLTRLSDQTLRRISEEIEK